MTKLVDTSNWMLGESYRGSEYFFTVECTKGCIWSVAAPLRYAKNNPFGKDFDPFLLELRKGGHFASSDTFVVKFCRNDFSCSRVLQLYSWSQVYINSIKDTDTMTHKDIMIHLLDGKKIRHTAWHTRAYIHLDAEGVLVDEDGLQTELSSDTSEYVVYVKPEYRSVAYEYAHLEFNKIPGTEWECAHKDSPDSWASWNGAIANRNCLYRRKL